LRALAGSGFRMSLDPEAPRTAGLYHHLDAVLIR
jgi:hypothetical protein